VPSELYVQVPARYGEFFYAAPGTPLHRLMKYGREAATLLHLHLRMVLYLREQQVSDGLIPDGAAYYLALPAPLRVAKRYVRQLADTGLIEPRDDDNYFVPAAVEWPVVRVGTRDPIRPLTRKRVHDRDDWRCVKCGSPDNLTLDHIIPWSQNGPDKEENLQTLCDSCNSAKGARVLWPASAASSPNCAPP
jgi:HNH endonuclease